LVVVVGFELRALYMLGRYSTTWTMPPSLFTLVVLGIGSHICWDWLGLGSSYLCFPRSCDDNTLPCLTFMFDMGSHELFTWAGLEFHSPPPQSPPPE
jgi:hypothetical protein